MVYIGPEECEVLKRKYHDLLTRGYHPKAARRIVCEAFQRVVKKRLEEWGSRHGMGQDSILTQAAQFEPIKEVREAVSPWLWVLSLTGFGMTVLNTRRIARMFKGWRGKRRK